MRSTRWLGAGITSVVLGLASLVALSGCASGPLAPAAGGGMMGMDPGRMMGQMLAGSAPQYVDSTKARSLGQSVPQNAEVNRSENRLILRSSQIQLAVLASPAGGPDMTFQIAGLTNPTIEVNYGSRITLQFINADADESHGWLLTAGSTNSYMPMMFSPIAFSGSAAAPLEAAGSGSQWPAETIEFTADRSGSFAYICPVPGHAQRGMRGTVAVTAS